MSLMSSLVSLLSASTILFFRAHFPFCVLNIVSPKVWLYLLSPVTTLNSGPLTFVMVVFTFLCVLVILHFGVGRYQEWGYFFLSGA